MKNLVAMLRLFLLLVVPANAMAQLYTVKKIAPGMLSINGTGKATAWKAGNVLDHFIYPWQKDTAPATSFSAVWDGQWLYCRFTVTDDSVCIYRVSNNKHETGASDRVEIFFKKDDAMSPYYCLEMDAAGRTLDYSAAYYRKMQYSWDWPKEMLQIKTSRTTVGYILEAAISIPYLEELGLLKDKRLQAGLFRAECTALKNGRPDFKWISWIDPRTAEPDFHIPAAFGILILE